MKKTSTEYPALRRKKEKSVVRRIFCMLIFALFALQGFAQSSVTGT